MADSYATMVGELKELPSPPMVIQRLQAIFVKNEITGREIAQIVETDQGFTARVLRLVNSPFYGFARKIVSVEEAISMLGFNSIKQLILATSMMNAFKNQQYAINMRKFWLHSLAVGVIAKHLLYNRNSDTQNEAFLCGLLHDVGRLIFSKMDPMKFTAFYFDMKSVTNIENETKFFGIDHQKLGELLAKKWNFPESIATVIANHHTPLEAKGHNLLVSAVNIADIVAHAFAIGDSANFYISDFYPEAWKTLGLDFERFEKTLHNALDDVDKSNETMGEFH
jgi:putative nucleotidyltransferase with HDIG domain